MHTIDKFASSHNTQVAWFNSRLWDFGSEAVDAFAVDWKGENNWLCPPVYFVPRVIRHKIVLVKNHWLYHIGGQQHSDHC